MTYRHQSARRSRTGSRDGGPEVDLGGREVGSGPPTDWSLNNFRPAWWLPGPHLQTLGARLLRSGRGVPFHRERLDTPDGDFVDLDIPFPENGDRTSPVVVVLHGLEGSARSKYALQAYRALHALGIRAIGFNFRSCSGVPNRLVRMYHSGETTDLHSVLEWIHRRLSPPAVGALGFSLGGNVLLKFLGERGASARAFVTAAVGVSVPFDLAAGADHLTRPGGRLYTSYLLRKLQRKLRDKTHRLPEGIDHRRAAAATTFREFDDAATAPLHGFADAADYYRRSSSAQYLERIRVRTLLLQALDDPFLPRRAIPHAAVKDNPHLTTAFTRRGGHVGFVTGRVPGRARFWAEEEAARFLANALGRATELNPVPGSVSSPST